VEKQMVQIETKVQSKNSNLFHAQLQYNEIIHYLDTHWSTTTTLHAISQLDEHFGFISKKLDTIIVSGTSGKSTTIHFTCKLLQEEGLKFGAFYTPHAIVYNERFTLNNEQISNNSFTQIANQVIKAAQDLAIEATSKDILTMMALIFFKENNVDVALFENAGTFQLDPVIYLQAKITAITRVVPYTKNDDISIIFKNITTVINPSTYVVCADQNKLNLHIIQQMTESKGGEWYMPIRKLTPLVYPLEQIHGRCSALAEKIVFIFINNILNKSNNEIISESLVSKTKGVRGRPTLEAKKSSIDNPKKTLEAFWSKTATTLPGRFQQITTTSPEILLDNADCIDSLAKVFLGIRLISYKKNFKSISLILGCQQNQFDDEEFIKELRYFAKKTSGSIAFCQIQPTVGEKSKESWNEQRIALIAKNAKIKVKTYKTFAEAFESVKNAHEENNSMIVITGSQAIVSQYLQLSSLNPE